ncbi:MAG TPA: hypothetical protein DD422_06060 [Akkermansia sp.]|nr:hypothetical protein [Akkermansia sp.]HBN17596.1 hypothetical protein [Akkermansia sp.]
MAPGRNPEIVRSGSHDENGLLATGAFAALACPGPVQVMGAAVAEVIVFGEIRTGNERNFCRKG